MIILIEIKYKWLVMSIKIGYLRDDLVLLGGQLVSSCLLGEVTVIEEYLLERVGLDGLLVD